MSRPIGVPDRSHDGRSGPPKRPQRIFEVKRVEPLSPHMVRLHLGGPGFDDFIQGAKPENLARTDKYVKFLIAKPELGLTPPFDLDTLRATLSPEDVPVRRTYTVRSIDRATKTIAIDFVVHGDEGVAGPWAARAKPGDVVALSGPGAQYAPSDDPAVTHVLLGDDSALPAIAAALEALPASAKGVAVIEVTALADILPLTSPTGVELRWLARGGSTPGEQLVGAVENLRRPAGAVQVFAHGERSAMKAVKTIMEGQWRLDRPELSLSAYWALGENEDRLQAEKHGARGHERS